MKTLSVPEIELLIDALEAMMPILTPVEKALAVELIEKFKVQKNDLLALELGASLG